jgi:hypothetical protein
MSNHAAVILACSPVLAIHTRGGAAAPADVQVNEEDTATQPAIYRKIRRRPTERAKSDFYNKTVTVPKKLGFVNSRAKTSMLEVTLHRQPR